MSASAKWWRRARTCKLPDAKRGGWQRRGDERVQQGIAETVEWVARVHGLPWELTMTTWSSRARRDAPLGFSRILVGVQRAGHLGQAHAEFRHQHKTLVAAYDFY